MGKETETTTAGGPRAVGQPLTFDQPYSTDKGFEIRKAGEKLTVEISDDWHGDSISGFGATLYYDLTREQAEQLRDWLDGFLAV